MDTTTATPQVPLSTILDDLTTSSTHAHIHTQPTSAPSNNTTITAPVPLPPSSMSFEDTNKSWDMLQFHRKARDHEKYCDAVLHVHGRQFLCHRLILAANSPYFDSIFQSRIATGAKSKNSQYYSKTNANLTRSVLMESLIIGCTEPDVFATFINFMYTGAVSIDKGNVAELLRLSNNFMVGKLKEYCASYLERFIDAENCVQVKEVGEKYGIQALVKVATQFVQNNLGEVINHEIMMELLPKQVEGFVMDKGFQIQHEVAVKFMSRWVCHDIPGRERDYKQMLTNIDWGTMDHETIVTYIDQEPLYGSSERCFYYILQSLGDKNIRVEKYEEIFHALQQRFGQEADQPLGYGDNLLQMAFNSAMEGLQVPTESATSWAEDKEKKSNNENIGDAATTKPKKLTLEQRRRRILRRVHRNRVTKRWVVIRLDRPKPKQLAYNEMMADSSGDEECDPAQTLAGYQCHMCPYMAKKISRLERHLACMHAHDVTYRCSECGYRCKWNREYFLHMKSHFDGPPYKCSLCDFTANKIGSLISHRISHLDLKPFHCTECEFKTRSKANLAVHLKTHNNEKPYRCGICGRNFASKNSLDQHAVGHNTDKTYSCTQCPFSTKYLNHFTNHKKTHHVQTGKKGKELYRCSDSTCKYTTSKKSQLESHMRSHAGVRPHVCSICGRRFLEKSHLVRHERIHFNERPFKCEECDYASTRRDKLKEHKTRHHGVNASAKSPYKPRPHKGKSGGGGAANGSQSSGDNSNPGSTGGGTGVVYAKKSGASSSAHQQVQQQSTSEQNSSSVVTSGNELEFIIPHGPHSTTPGGDENGEAYVQLTGQSGAGSSGGLDLQHMSNTVQLRPYQQQVVVSLPTSSSSSYSTSTSTPHLISGPAHTSTSSPVISIPSTSSSTTATLLNSASLMAAIQQQQQNQNQLFKTSPSSSKIVAKPGQRIILVQQQQGSNKGGGTAGQDNNSANIAQTLASFPHGGAISSHDLQRTLGIKLEDLQAGGLIGIGTGVGGAMTARAIKLEELTGMSTQTLTTSSARGIPGTTTTMLLDAAQLQQLTQQSSSSSHFERGIPITISSLQLPSSGGQPSISVVSSQQQQQQQQIIPQQNNSSSSTPTSSGGTSGGQNQATTTNQQNNPNNDFSGLNNLFC